MIKNNSACHFRAHGTVAASMISATLLFASVGCTEGEKASHDHAQTEVTTASATSEQVNKLSPQEEKEGWVLLFDGTSTDAWRGYNQKSFPEKGWQVKDGLLMVERSGTEEEGFGGDIITKEQYENFEFKTDFRLSPEGNSGIVYLVKEVEGVPSWHNAPEYQLLDNEHYEKTGEIPMDKHRTGDNYDLHASTVNAMKPVGEWNEAKIRVQEGRVEHWLNGQKVVEYTLQSPEWKELVKNSKFAGYPGYGMAKKGHIGIQDHGHQLWYRNIKVRPL